jgi:predicted exporter
MTAATPAAPRPGPRFLAWTALMLVLLGVFAWRVLPQPRIETDILALLPHADGGRELDAALETFSARLARRQIFLVGGASLEASRVAAQAFAKELAASGAFAEIRLELAADVQQRFALYLSHRAWLLSPGDARALESGETATLAKRALRSAYTLSGFLQPLGLAADPLGLLGDFLRATMPVSGRAGVVGSNLVVERDDKSYLVLLTESAGNPFSSETQQQVIPALERARAAALAAAESPVEIIGSGAIRHAAAAAQRAESEVQTFGLVEALAVVLLLLVVFGSLRPLLLGMLTLALAVTAAFTVVHLVFGKVHILALVFGSSLIGSVIDYSIHFFADRFRQPAEAGRWSAWETARHVGPAILLGLTTTLLGYLVLAVVPFPGLEQIAVFCMTGLLVGAGCVLCLYPVLAQSAGLPPRLGPRLGAGIDGALERWHWSTPRRVLGMLVIVVLALGITRLRVEDDVKALQQSPPDLVKEEQRVRDLLGGGVETRFFLVSGGSPEAVLRAEERLAAALQPLVRDGALASWQAVSSALPSQARQQRNHALLERHVYAPQGLLEQVMRELGFPAADIERRRAEFATPGSPLALDEWLRSSASAGLRHLWLGPVGTGYASVVTLGGISDVTRLSALDVEGARLIDRLSQTTAVLARYRVVMSWLLLGVAVVAGVVLTIRFGFRDASRMVLPPAAAVLVTLGIFGWLGEPFNLFTLLAFWLVLGLSIDYGIFLRHGREHRVTAILSVTLSACTTLIAFGLLSLSATPFIRTIGLTLLCAITLSWSFALIVGPLRRSPGMTERHQIHG